MMVCNTTVMHPQGMIFMSLNGEDGKKNALPVEPEVILTKHITLPAGPGRGHKAMCPCSVTAPGSLSSAKATLSSFSYPLPSSLLSPFMEVWNLTSLPVKKQIMCCMTLRQIIEA